MKNVLKLTMICLLAIALIATGCGNKNNDAGNGGNKNTGEEKNTGNANNGGNAAEGKALKVSMVTDTGGVNDNSFNQSAWDGLNRLKDDTGTEVQYLQSTSDAEYEVNLNQFVKAGWNLTWGIGFMMGDALKTVAQQNPNANLAIIDAVVEAPNVVSVTFKENEGSYLVGAVAGMMTKTGKIGFVGGAEIPVIKNFELGFVEGVKAVNPNATVNINYTGKFDAPDLGKSTAATMYDNGVDIIFHASGQTGDGVFNEAKDRKKNGTQVWVIGVDKDQSTTFGTEITLTSMMKRVDEAVYLVSKSLVEGTFKGGQITSLGLVENGVGLPAENPNLTEEVMNKVKELQEKIINGDIKVPTAYE